MRHESARVSDHQFLDPVRPSLPRWLRLLLLPLVPFLLDSPTSPLKIPKRELADGASLSQESVRKMEEREKEGRKDRAVVPERRSRSCFVTN